MTDEQVFLAALELADADARAAYLDKACGVETELRQRVEELLAAHFKSGTFLDEPITEQLGHGHAEAPATIADKVCASDYVGDAAHDSATQSATAETLHFLAPSGRSDSLGRIGHYEVLQVLGKGGFGIVLRAFDEVLQRVVALKVLAPEIAATSPARKRFLREAQASARVRHENVVQIHAVEELPTPYLVMEFVAGETLQQRLDRHGPLDAAEVVSLGRQIAEGLAAAHATRLIHRDIKPGNILVESGASQRIKITDFGLARAADDASMTQSGVVAGTPMFMAPEQAKGETLDQRADLFSLGSVLYVMTSGRPPFRAATMFAVLRRVVEEEPRRITDLIPETPPRLCEIIDRLHAKNPDERYQTAIEVARDLADCEAHLKEHPLAKSPQLSAPQARPANVRMWVAAAAIVLLPVAVLTATELAGMTRLFSPSHATQHSAPNVVKLVQQTPQDEKWISLFNGKDLTGWKTHPDQTGQWQVQEGVLVGTNTDSYLFTDLDAFQDFHLRLEAKINPGGDSGIYLRSPFSMRRARTAGQLRPAAGYEIEVQASPTHALPTGSVWDAETDGPPKALWKTSEVALMKPNEWFTLEIMAVGNHITTKVNGTVTADVIDPRRRYERGHLALQSYSPSTTIQFRNIDLQPLSPSLGRVER